MFMLCIDVVDDNNVEAAAPDVENEHPRVSVELAALH